MTETLYIAHDDRGISWPVSREAASRLSRAGLWVSAVTTRGDSNE